MASAQHPSAVLYLHADGNLSMEPPAGKEGAAYDVLKISMLLFLRFRVHSPLPILPLRDSPEAAPVTVKGKSLQYSRPWEGEECPP